MSGWIRFGLSGGFEFFLSSSKGIKCMSDPAKLVYMEQGTPGKQTWSHLGS